jgi:GNAT superfamily N-acetyltransferase
MLACGGNNRATLAWLCDVSVAAPARGQGVGTRLVRAIIEHPELQGPRRWALRTQDAHSPCGLFGFTALADPRRGMERHNPDVYADRERRSDQTRTPP